MSPFSRPASIRHGDRLLARAVFLLLLAVYTATFTGLPENPDAEVEFQSVSSLVRTGSLALGGTPEADALVAAGHAVHAGGPGREGRWYSWFGVGQALTGVPFYLAGRGLHRLFPGFEQRNAEGTYFGVHRSEYFEHLLVGWRNPLLGAMTAWLLVITARRLGAGRRAAFFGGLTYGLCTYAWPQARSTLSDVQATFLVFLAFHQAVKLRERYARFHQPHRTDLAMFGIALGGAFLTRVATAPAVAVLVVALLLIVWYGRTRLGAKARTLSDLAWALGPALLALAAWLWLNQARFGDPLESGYGDAVGANYFSYPPWLGLLMLLAAPGKGLLVMAPGVLLALPWLWRNLRGGADPLGGWTILFVSLAVFGMVVPTEGWHGAWTYGPRYVLPALPFLWVGVTHTLGTWRDRSRVRIAGSLLFGLGFLTSVPGVLIDYTTHHDLAIRAARIAWPDVEGDTAAEREGARFLKIHQDWRFAAPLVHWRIFRHRVALGDESYPVREIFLLEDPSVLEPSEERFRGANHLAWVDFERRLGGTTALGWIFSLVLAGVGGILASRGLDQTLR